MPIIGIERLIYCVDDVDLSADFMKDFGLGAYDRAEIQSRFNLPDGSAVHVRPKNFVPQSQVVGTGVHEIVWGVDSVEHLERLVANVSKDRDVWRDSDGIAHFVAEGGIVMGLRYWPEFRTVFAPTDPVNSPGCINRMNVHRRWIARAVAKRISHVGFIVDDFEASFAFMRDRLGFRLSDRQRDFAIYCRADGAYDHHNIVFMNAKSRSLRNPPSPKFQHSNFVVTDLDEIMVGKNYMERRGWEKSPLGIGRHRIASSLFLYLPCPAGGEIEYGADGDALDDGWVPRDFDQMFGIAHWIHDMPEFWRDGPNWDVVFAEGEAPFAGSVGQSPALSAAQKIDALP